jgi:hypothetical protein
MSKPDFLIIPNTNPEKIFQLRDSSYANDLFIAAIAYLDIFNVINKSSLSFVDLCSTLKIKERPADVLITLLKSYNFLDEINEVMYLTDLSKDFLIKSSQFDLSTYIDSLKDRPICIEMLKVLQTGEPINWSSKNTGTDWASSMNDEKFAESFTKSQNSRGVYLANGILNCIDFSNRNKILDIGGSSGIYSAVLLNKYPNLSATIFEKSPVDKVTQYFIDKNSIKNMSVSEGDMFEDNFPDDYDVHLISHVLHDWDKNSVEKILMNSFNSLNSNGKLIIHDAHINESKNGPVSVAEYSVLLMSSTFGKCYSIIELKEILKKIGFKNIEYKEAFVNRSVIIADK